MEAPSSETKPRNTKRVKQFERDSEDVGVDAMMTPVDTEPPSSPLLDQVAASRHNNESSPSILSFQNTPSPIDLMTSTFSLSENSIDIFRELRELRVNLKELPVSLILGRSQVP